MRRARKKFTWMPILPTDVGDGEQGATWYQGQAFVSPSDDAAYVQWIPITYDETPTDANEGDGTLRDRVEGQEYVVERIVGKIWGAVTQDATPDNSWANAIIACGICVAPFNNDGSLGITLPELNPLAADNADKSWMFRRTCTVWNNIQPQSNYTGPTGFQNDGPDYGHVDVRSVRRVHRDERLIVVFAYQPMFNIGTPTENEFTFGYDFRVLGAMRKARLTSSYK